MPTKVEVSFNGPLNASAIRVDKTSRRNKVVSRGQVKVITKVLLQQRQRSHKRPV